MIISVVVPCYNEEASIFLFYEETIKTLTSHMEVQETVTPEFIFVDDGSVDSTGAVLKKLAAQDSRVQYIIFSRNFGKEAALLAGLKKAQGQYIITIDADLQDPPALIPSMLKAVASGEFDCAGSRRITRKGEPPVRSFFARCFYRVMKKISDIEIVDSVHYHLYIYMSEYFHWGRGRSETEAPSDMPVVLDSYYHTIRSSGEHIRVLFKN
jgi:glycosyltransferase involved in cell wall biosynthesis